MLFVCCRFSVSYLSRNNQPLRTYILAVAIFVGRFVCRGCSLQRGKEQKTRPHGTLGLQFGVWQSVIFVTLHGTTSSFFHVLLWPRGGRRAEEHTWRQNLGWRCTIRDGSGYWATSKRPAQKTSINNIDIIERQSDIERAARMMIVSCFFSSVVVVSGSCGSNSREGSPGVTQNNKMVNAADVCVRRCAAVYASLCPKKLNEMIFAHKKIKW